MSVPDSMEEWVGKTVEELELEIQQIFKEDCEWVDVHHQELLAQYPNQWIAVRDQRVVIHLKTLRGLVRRAVRINLSLKNSVVKYLDPDPLPLILSCAASPCAS